MNGPTVEAGRTPMLALMHPDEEQLRRTVADDGRLPRWFASPIIQAGFDVHFLTGQAPMFREVAHFARRHPSACLLIFTLSLREFFSAMVFRHRLRICSLFQWIPMESVPAHKRICYRMVLASSRVIAVYNRLAEDYIRQRFPKVPLARIGLYVDTDYFAPRPKAQSSEQAPFLLCPGSHRRDEALAIQIAQEAGLRLVRFSQGACARKFYEERKPAIASLESNISFERMRELYAQAEAVINVVDDSQFPAGITCFAEALSMNCLMATPKGHSSAGYEFADGTRPYHAIANWTDLSEWIRAVRCMQKQKQDWEQGRSPRDLALQMCSRNRATEDWLRIRRLLNTRV